MGNSWACATGMSTLLEGTRIAGGAGWVEFKTADVLGRAGFGQNLSLLLLVDWAFALRLAGGWLRCGSFGRREVDDLLALSQARLAGGAQVFRSHLVRFEEPEQGVDELARILPAVFPARQGFLATAENVRELVLACILSLGD